MVEPSTERRIASVRSLGIGSLDDGSETVTELQVTTTTTTTTDRSANKSLSSNGAFPSATGLEYDPDAWRPESVQYTVNLWELRAEERTKLEQLGQRLTDVHHFKNRPSDVIRFLKSHHDDVHKAETVFRAMIEWRRESNADTILRDYTPPDSIKDYYPFAVLKGLDKDGDPVLAIRTGQTDGAGLLQRHGLEEMLRYVVWCREMTWHGPWMREYEEKQQRQFKWFTIIDDNHELQILAHIANRPLIKNFSTMVKIDKENYPLGAKQAFVIRAPSLIQMLWGIVKLFFHAEAAKKVNFLSARNYQKQLSQHLDIEMLPEEFVPGIGKGQARDGFPTKFAAGPVPPKA